MWGYGQCMDTIHDIVLNLNTMFSMLIEMLTNDSLLQTATTSLPNLVSAIKATAITLCVMFFLIDFFAKSTHFQWVTWENVLVFVVKLFVAKICVDNAELFTTIIYRGFNGFVGAIAGTITQYSFSEHLLYPIRGWGVILGALLGEQRINVNMISNLLCK